jgi:hypothetical protein
MWSKVLLWGCSKMSAWTAVTKDLMGSEEPHSKWWVPMAVGWRPGPLLAGRLQEASAPFHLGLSRGSHDMVPAFPHVLYLL